MNTTHNSTTPITLRRNTTATSSSSSSSTTTTSSPTSCSSSVDFELVSINGNKPTCYTSLRDILPSPATVVHSPKTPHSAANAGYEILIRDRLVKQAAWAYLQPMSTSPEPDGFNIEIRRMWTQFSGSLLRVITAAFDCLLLSVHM